MPSFALIAEPLTKLLKKKVPFIWSNEQKEAFKAIVQALLKNATLAQFDHKLPTLLKTDASKNGIAGILLQKHGEDWRIAACTSRRLNESERNYSITDLEDLALINSMQKFRQYLLGKHFEVLVDHCPLCVLNSRSPQTDRLRRWAIIVSEFDFKITHTKGALDADVDCLSRAPIANEIDNFMENKVYSVRIMPT